MVNAKPDFWTWCYHITRKWKAPAKVNGTRLDVPKVIGFALAMATYGREGTRICPSATTLARQLHLEPRSAQRLRKLCVQLGLFRRTGKRWANIEILEIAIPPDAVEHAGQWAGKDCAACMIMHRAGARIPEMEEAHHGASAMVG